MNGNKIFPLEFRKSEAAAAAACRSEGGSIVKYYNLEEREYSIKSLLVWVRKYAHTDAADENREFVKVVSSVNDKIEIRYNGALINVNEDSLVTVLRALKNV